MWKISQFLGIPLNLNIAMTFSSPNSNICKVTMETIFKTSELTTNNAILMYHIITLSGELLQSEKHIKKVNFKSYQNKSF